MPSRTRQASTARTAERSGNMTFVENLLRLMRENGQTSGDLAGRIGISRQAISQWLLGQSSPSNRRLAQLANALGVGVDRLFMAQPEEFEAKSPVSHTGATDDVLLIGTIDAGSDGKHDSTTPVVTDAVPPWPLPRIAIKGRYSEESEIVAMRVADNALEPLLMIGDFVFVDVSVSSQTVATPGIYMLIVAGLRTCRHCRPLIGERLLIADSVVQQEALASEISVQGKVIRWLAGPHAEFPRDVRGLR